MGHSRECLRRCRGFLSGQSAGTALASLWASGHLNCAEYRENSKVETFDDLIRQLQSEESETKLQAIEKLGLLRDRRAVPILADLVRDPSRKIRAYALLALGEIGYKAALDQLVVFFDLDNLDDRLIAASAFTTTHTKASYQRLVDIAHNPSLSTRKRAAAIWATKEFPYRFDVLVLPFVFEFIHHENDEIRGSAIEVVGQIKDERSVEILINALKDSNEQIRWSAAYGLKRTVEKNNDVIKALIETLGDVSSGVREVVAISLGFSKDANVLPHLERLKEQDVDEKVQKGATWAVEYIKSL